MADYFTFGNVDSRNYGIYLYPTRDIYKAAEREYDTIEIPGRSGDLLIDAHRYSNVDVTYECLVPELFTAHVKALRDILLATTGYATLADSFNTDEFRKAYYTGQFEIRRVSRDGGMGSFDVTFHCKPQRFLTSGESTSTIANGGTITNPTNMIALPVVTVRATAGAVNGTVTINGQTMTISQPPFYAVALDSELQSAYNGVNNLNSYVSGEFFVLAPGDNSVAYTGNITSVEIKPRWWRL